MRFLCRRLELRHFVTRMCLHGGQRRFSTDANLRLMDTRYNGIVIFLCQSELSENESILRSNRTVASELVTSMDETNAAGHVALSGLHHRLLWKMFSSKEKQQTLSLPGQLGVSSDSPVCIPILSLSWSLGLCLILNVLTCSNKASDIPAISLAWSFPFRTGRPETTM